MRCGTAGTIWRVYEQPWAGDPLPSRERLGRVGFLSHRRTGAKDRKARMSLRSFARVSEATVGWEGARASVSRRVEARAGARAGALGGADYSVSSLCAIWHVAGVQ